MCVNAEKPKQNEDLDPPELPTSSTTGKEDAICCDPAGESLIERVVDFMNTYNEN